MADKGFLDDILDNIGVAFSGGKGFTAGPHTVNIIFAEDGTKKVKDGTEADIITVHVQDPSDEDIIGEATLWFHTEGGAKMAVTKIGGLLVHNADEDKKEKFRDLIKQAFAAASAKGDLKATQTMCLKLIAEKLIGKEAFITAEPQGDYDTTKYVDLWHYEQRAATTEKEAATSSDVIESGEDVTDTVELPEGW